MYINKEIIYEKIYFDIYISIYKCLNLFSQVDMNKLKQLQMKKIIMKLLKAMNKYYYRSYNKDALQNIINLYINIVIIHQHYLMRID